MIHKTSPRPGELVHLQHHPCPVQSPHLIHANSQNGLCIHSRPYTQGKDEKESLLKSTLVRSLMKWSVFTRVQSMSTSELLRIQAAVSDETSNTPTTLTIQPTAVSPFSINGPAAKKQNPNPKDFVDCQHGYHSKAIKARAKDAKLKVCIECVNDVKVIFLVFSVATHRVQLPESFIALFGTLALILP